MPFPKRNPGAAPAEKKPRKFTKDGNLIGCGPVLGPERLEVDGQTVDVTVQVSYRKKAVLTRLAAAAMARPDGIKSLQHGLFHIVVRPAQAGAGPAAAQPLRPGASGAGTPPRG